MIATVLPSASTHRPATAAPSPAPARVRLLGQPLDLLTPDQVLNEMAQAVALRRRTIIANHNLNSLNLIRTDPQMQAFYAAADRIQIDSTPLIAFGRLLGLPMGRRHRSTYLDWREAFWARAAAQGWRVLYVGGAPEVGDTAVRRLSRRWPVAVIAARSGYFDAAPGATDNAQVLAEVRDFAPDILMVGMGMPRQEAWIARNLDALPNCVILNVGAAFDYEASVQKAAPRWMGRIGLEWLYRLACDPRRLFRRYLVEPWSLAGPAAADIFAALRRRF